MLNVLHVYTLVISGIIVYSAIKMKVKEYTYLYVQVAASVSEGQVEPCISKCGRYALPTWQNEIHHSTL